MHQKIYVWVWMLFKNLIFFPSYKIMAEIQGEQGQSQLKFKIEKPQQFQRTQLINGSGEVSQLPADVLFCILAVATKISPVILFFALSQSYILDFTLVLITASVDFWTIKNITGRKLVGMTWWMKVNEETGDEQWIFHSSDDSFKTNDINEKIFWGSSLLSCVFWGLATILSLIISRLFWIALCAVCFILSAINFTFFLKCRGNHQQRFKQLVDKMGLASASQLVEDNAF